MKHEKTTQQSGPRLVLPNGRKRELINSCLTAIDEPISKTLVAMVEDVLPTRLATAIAFSLAVAVVQASPNLWRLLLVMICRTQMSDSYSQGSKQRRRWDVQKPEHFPKVHAGTW